MIFHRFLDLHGFDTCKKMKTTRWEKASPRPLLCFRKSTGRKSACESRTRELLLTTWKLGRLIKITVCYIFNGKTQKGAQGGTRRMSDVCLCGKEQGISAALVRTRTNCPHGQEGGWRERPSTAGESRGQPKGRTVSQRCGSSEPPASRVDRPLLSSSPSSVDLRAPPQSY